ncbi:hypothetical protein VNO80_07104 [Phaseolus coccineus]|uniref:Uncharacterized protein n=1 Tax=Phaseolus coccineus TaxID=3886 RepID=A0AAN9NPY9_PHACN
MHLALKTLNIWVIWKVVALLIVLSRIIKCTANLCCSILIRSKLFVFWWGILCDSFKAHCFYLAQPPMYGLSLFSPP